MHLSLLPTGAVWSAPLPLRAFRQRPLPQRMPSLLPQPCLIHLPLPVQLIPPVPLLPLHPRSRHRQRKSCLAPANPPPAAPCLWAYQSWGLFVGGSGVLHETPLSAAHAKEGGREGCEKVRQPALRCRREHRHPHLQGSAHYPEALARCPHPNLALQKSPARDHQSRCAERRCINNATHNR